ncbi:poly(glycerol-phosphate) alpha-glucosyltransferase [Arthrobacter crystallopoietes]|uniref:Poly(Glycerol-phosphate) alpha-glucosyltransferase n=1 Tax=Crystallibacter crystallopoietes TaxID=37928 RepID=A0A1H1G9C5_9MICC|nr:poly(glycerol-phosphate) alpha-glucosyltransferase [Arthrobacter crystallopoietes]
MKAVRNRASALAEEGSFAGIHIDVLGFQPRLSRTVKMMKDSGHLHPAVQVNSVLYSLDPSPETERRKPSFPSRDSGLTGIKDGRNPQSVRYFRDGLLEMFVRTDPAGTPVFIDYFNSERQRVRRDEMDSTGRLVRVLHTPVTPGESAVQRYIGRDGQCFLTIWQSPGKNNWEQGFLFGPKPRSFPEMGILYTHAFEQLLAQHESVAITSEFRENLDILRDQNLDEVVASIRHPHLRKVVTAHSNHLEPPYTAGSGVSGNWRRLIHRLDEFDALVLLTEAQREDIAADFGHAELLEVIPQVAPPRKEANAPTDPNRLVLVARTHPKKRVDEAIRVFRKVVDGNPDAVLEVFGFGYKDKEELKVHQLVADLSLQDSVRFMPFTSNPDDIYAAACATLLTSASEGFPLILLESMSYGVPVVAYDSNYGPRDVIIDSENGYLADFADSDALAKKILLLMQDADQRARMGAAAVETLDRFDTARFVEGWKRVLTAPPRPDRITRASTRAVVEHVEWNGKKLYIRAPHGTAPGTELIFRRRHTDNATEVPVSNGQWIVQLPESKPGDIFDAYIRLADHSEKRMALDIVDVVQRPPMQVYATAHGSFSVRHVNDSLVAKGRRWLKRRIRAQAQ